MLVLVTYTVADDPCDKSVRNREVVGLICEQNMLLWILCGE